MEWDRRWLSLGGELTFEKMQFRTPSGLCRPLAGAKSPSPNRPVKRDFRFPENEFWNLPLEMAFLFGDRVFGRMSGQNGCNVDSFGVFGRFRGLPTAFIRFTTLKRGLRYSENVGGNWKGDIYFETVAIYFETRDIYR